jgi:hypothetical protein
MSSFMLTLARLFSWLIDNDKDQEGLQVLADLHGGDLNNSVAQAEFKEIRAKVILEVMLCSFYPLFVWDIFDCCFKRESGEGRSYRTMWNKYSRRVLLAMSSQAFAQLVSKSLSKKRKIWIFHG